VIPPDQLSFRATWAGAQVIFIRAGTLLIITQLRLEGLVTRRRCGTVGPMRSEKWSRWKRRRASALGPEGRFVAPNRLAPPSTSGLFRPPARPGPVSRSSLLPGTSEAMRSRIAVNVVPELDGSGHPYGASHLSEGSAEPRRPLSGLGPCSPAEPGSCDPSLHDPHTRDARLASAGIKIVDVQAKRRYSWKKARHSSSHASVSVSCCVAVCVDWPFDLCVVACTVNV